jgi:hypothetical protein
MATDELKTEGEPMKPYVLYRVGANANIKRAAYKTGIGSPIIGSKIVASELPTYPPHRGIGGFSFLAGRILFGFTVSLGTTLHCSCYLHGNSVPADGLSIL